MASYKTLSGYLIAICGNSKKIERFKIIIGQSQSQRVLIFIFFLKEQFLYPVYIMLICHNKPFHWLI